VIKKKFILTRLNLYLGFPEFIINIRLNLHLVQASVCEKTVFINVNVALEKFVRSEGLLEIETAKFYIDFNLKIFCGCQGTF
jgi:hypothetical protein